MLSFGAPSAYNDILFPTSYQYGGNPDYKYISEEDMPWDEKENGLYWRGSPTGGGYGDKEFGSVRISFYLTPILLILSIPDAPAQTRYNDESAHARSSRRDRTKLHPYWSRRRE